MGPEQQTKITDENRKDFYTFAYQMQTDQTEDLINLSGLTDPVIIIDCCGWHYQNFYPKKHIISIETIQTCLNYKLDPTKFDKLVDDRDIGNIKWPNLDIRDSTVIFDRSPILKYRSIKEINHMLEAVGQQYQAESMVVRGFLLFVDDARLSEDRFYNFQSINVSNFIIIKFLYDTTNLIYEIWLKRKK